MQEKMRCDPFSAFRVDLLSPVVDRETKIGRLRDLLEMEDKGAVRSLLGEAARVEANREILEFIVRGYGYLEDPGAVGDLLPFLEHESTAVLLNAAKALMALSPESAVTHLTPVLRKSRSDLAQPLAELLVDRCWDHCEGLFMKFAFSRKQRHRSLAVYYLRRLDPEESIPLALEMIRREHKSGNRNLLMKFLKIRARPEDRPRIQRTLEQLLAIIEDIDASLGAGPDPGKPTAGVPTAGVPTAEVDLGGNVSRRLEASSDDDST